MLYIAALAFTLFGITSLNVSADNRVFYSEKNKAYKALEAFENKYLPSHNILVSVTRDLETDFTEQLQTVEALESFFWGIEDTLRVDSLLNYPVVVANELELATENYLEINCTSPRCNLSGPITSEHPEIVGRFVSEDGRSLSTVATLQLDINDTGKIEGIDRQVEQFVSQLQAAHPSLTVKYTGGIPMMAAFAAAANRDTATVFPIALLLTACALGILLRRPLACAGLLIVGLGSSASTMGLAGLVGFTLNSATSITSVIVFSITIVTGMHICISYFNDLEIYDPETALANAIAANFKPVFLSALTSILAFLSLLSADAPPFGELGILAAYGVFIGTLGVLTILPSFLSRSRRVHAPIRSHTNLFLSRIAALKIHRFSSWIGALALVAVALGCLNLTINDDFVGYFSERTQFRQNTDHIESVLTGPNHIELDLTTTTSVFSPEYLSEIESLTDWLRSLPVVANVFSFTDVMKQLREAYEAEDPTSTQLHQLYVAYSMSLQYGQSTSDFVRPDLDSSRVSVLLKKTTSNDIKNLSDAIERKAGTYNSFTATITGENVPVATLTIDNAKSMITGLALSIAVASALLGLSFGKARVIMIAFLAVSMPLALAFGLWGIFVGEIGLAAIVVISMNLGIVIDDGIHVITRFLNYASEPARSAGDAYRLTVERVGPALIYSTIALCAGFAALVFSDFLVNSQLGLLTIVALLISLAIDLVLLPRILLKVGNVVNPAIVR